MDYITQPQGGRELICSEGGEILIKPNAKITAEPGAIVTGFNGAPGAQEIQNSCSVTYSGGPFNFSYLDPDGWFWEWDTNVYDTSNMHSTSVNPSRINIPDSGIYAIDFQMLAILTEGVGQVATGLYKNSNTILHYQPVPYFDRQYTASLSFSVIRKLEAGDYIEIAFSPSDQEPDGGQLPVAQPSYFNVSQLGTLAT